MASSQLEVINEKLAKLDTFIVKVDSLSQIMLGLKPEIGAVKAIVLEVQSSVNTLSQKYDCLAADCDAREAVVTDLSSKVCALEVQVSEQSLAIQELQCELNDAQQYSRSANLEIHGVPCTPNEDLTNTVSDLAAKLEIISFNATQVVAAHRLPVRSDRLAPILVRFASIAVRDEWLAARGKLRH